MAVVPAGVHLPRCLAHEGQRDGFRQRKRVDVRPPSRHRPRLVPAQDTHDAGFRDARAHLQSGLGQAFGDDGSRARFLEPQLWMPVKIAPEGDQAVVALLGFLDQVESGFAEDGLSHCEGPIEEIEGKADGDG